MECQLAVRSGQGPAAVLTHLRSSCGLGVGPAGLPPSPGRPITELLAGTEYRNVHSCAGHVDRAVRDHVVAIAGVALSDHGRPGVRFAPARRCTSLPLSGHFGPEDVIDRLDPDFPVRFVKSGMLSPAWGTYGSTLFGATVFRVEGREA